MELQGRVSTTCGQTISPFSMGLRRFTRRILALWADCMVRCMYFVMFSSRGQKFLGIGFLQGYTRLEWSAAHNCGSNRWQNAQVYNGCRGWEYAPPGNGTQSRKICTQRKVGGLSRPQPRLTILVGRALAATLPSSHGNRRLGVELQDLSANRQWLACAYKYTNVHVK